MIGKLRRTLLNVICILLCAQAALVYAAQGGLHLVTVSVTGGGEVQQSAEVSTEPQFKVKFDKNVTNDAIWEDNIRCFSIVGANGEAVPVVVSKSEDFSQRQIIFVQPENPLKPGTAYNLKISSWLRAKNGATLGGEDDEDISVAFNTMSEQTAQTQQPAEEGKAQGVDDGQ